MSSFPKVGPKTLMELTGVKDYGLFGYGFLDSFIEEDSAFHFSFLLGKEGKIKKSKLILC